MALGFLWVTNYLSYLFGMCGRRGCAGAAFIYLFILRQGLEVGSLGKKIRLSWEIFDNLRALFSFLLTPIHFKKMREKRDFFYLSIYGHLSIQGSDEFPANFFSHVTFTHTQAYTLHTRI